MEGLEAQCSTPRSRSARGAGKKCGYCFDECPFPQCAKADVARPQMMQRQIFWPRPLFKTLLPCSKMAIGVDRPGIM
jgi:hypothetical protein